MAALLASGQGAVLTYRAATRLWGVASISGLDATVPKQRGPAAGIDLDVTLLPLSPHPASVRDRSRA